MTRCLFLSDADDPRVKTCARPNCGNQFETDDAAERCFAQCRSPAAPSSGLPGTELAKILRGLGIELTAECRCEEKTAQMDAWRADGCRLHFDEIVGWLREGAAKFNWTDKLRAGALAAASGLAFQISWADPFSDIARLAIERAEAKALQPRA